MLKACWLHSAGDIHDIQSYLVKIKDQAFVLSECVNKVGPTEAALKALFSFGFRMTGRYKFSEPDNSGDGSAWDSRIIRLRLLWYNDLLETFLGINMGRYVVAILTVFSLHNKCSQFTLEVFATMLQLLSHIDPAKVYKYNRFNFFHHTCIGRFESQCNILKRTIATFEYCFIPQANQLRLCHFLQFPNEPKVMPSWILVCLI